MVPPTSRRRASSGPRRHGPAPADRAVGWEADVALRDGAMAHIRPVVPGDAEGIQAMHLAQSDQSVYFRFFSPIGAFSTSDLERFTVVDHRDRVALVVLIRGELVGVGRYDRIGAEGEQNGDVAEVAFYIADSQQGRGLASVLLEHLAAAAREGGIRRFVAEVLPQNRAMIGVFAAAGFEVTRTLQDGVVEISFDIRPGTRFYEVMAEREQRSDARTLTHLLRPRAVAVLGASRDEDSVGRAVLRHLRASGWDEHVHVVNRSADEIDGFPSYARLSDLPRPVDLAVVAVPPAEVERALAACGEVGIAVAIVVTSGYGEVDAAGADRQRSLVRTARSLGIRIVGPASLGVLSTLDDAPMNASLLPRLPRPGRLGVMSHSAALGVQAMSALDGRGLGVSTFVGAGNRVDVSGNDCLQFWAEDPGTDRVALYLESVGNPRKFVRITRRLAGVKPVVVLMTTDRESAPPPGQTIPASEAGPRTLDAVLETGGVIRARSVEHLVDIAELLEREGAPAGDRVAVVANDPALGELARHAAEREDLAVMRADVSMPRYADEDQIAAGLRAAFVAPHVDCVLVTLLHPGRTSLTRVTEQVRRLVADSGRPAVCAFIGYHDEVTALVENPGTAVPVFAGPDRAAAALGPVAKWAATAHRTPEEIEDREDVDRQAARELCETALAGAGEPLELDEGRAAELLACYGIEVVPSQRVTTLEEGVAAADRLGWPVALKSTDPDLRHRTDLGSVRLDVMDAEQMRLDVEAMRAAVPWDTAGFEVQPMVPPGAAVVLRTREDPRYGPLVTFSLSGDATELLDDIAVAIPPLRLGDARGLVRGTRSSQRLRPRPDRPAADLAGLEDLVVRLSLLSEDLPHVQALDLHPVVVATDGVHALSARVRLAPPPQRTDTLRRTLGPI